MSKIINLFSGPGAGKSTTAAGLFFYAKQAGAKVELITEYAKDLTYGKHFIKLKDTLYVFAKQHHRIVQLMDQVDYVITDSPLPLCLAYTSGIYKSSWFSDAVLSTFTSYDNFNVEIIRTKPYAAYGRSQTEDEARALDLTIKDIVHDYRINMDMVLPGDEDAPKAIWERVSNG